MSLRVFEDYESDGERFEVYQTQHQTKYGEATAETAFHNAVLSEGRQFPNSIGGMRIVERGERSELCYLSAAMTEKCLAAGLPCSGQKSLIVFPRGVPAELEARAEVLEQHIRIVARARAGAIFGPDMNVPEQVVDLIARDAGLHPHLAGCSAAHGGLAIDEEGYTGMGLAAAIGVVREKRGELELRSASIQGFGAVGAHCARLLARQGILVRAVSIKDGTLLAKDPGSGLPVEELFAAWRNAPESERDAAVEALGRHHPAVKWVSSPHRIFKVHADIFVPAARTTILATRRGLTKARKENRDVRDVLEFAKDSRVRLVAEGANHPLTYSAEGALEARQVMVLPDYICNAGGLVGCYFEWDQRSLVLKTPRRRELVARAAQGYASEVICRNTARMLDLLQLEGPAKKRVGARMAAKTIVDEERAQWARLPDPASEWRRLADGLLEKAAGARSTAT